MPSRGRDLRMRPRRVHKVILGLAVLVGLTFCPALAQEKKEPEKPWVGKFADGRPLTRAELERILEKHRLWTEGDKSGEKAT